MKATVGPLPPAVYWRRRAIVIGALVVLVVLLVAMCSGGGNKSKPNARRSGSASNGPTTSTSSPAVLPPIVGESAPSDGGGGDGGNGDTNPTASPGGNGAGGPNGGGAGGQQPASVGGCADTDLSLTAEATPLAGGGFHFIMKVKNISNHACSRDVGGGPQELVVTGPSGTWSSNSCAAPGATPAPDVRTFQPGVEATLPAKPFTWDGSINKCSGGTKAGAGTYHLVAKLATKASDSVPVVIGK
jgi:hypothetical protein